MNVYLIRAVWTDKDYWRAFIVVAVSQGAAISYLENHWNSIARAKLEITLIPHDKPDMFAPDNFEGGY